MSAPVDPRTEPGWKAKRYEDRQLAMLGAILDALLALKPVTPAVPEPPATTTRRREKNVG